VTCGIGIQTRTRSCVQGDSCGFPCSGPSQETRSCGKAPVDAKWSDFGAWSACSVTRGMGTQTRTRHCVGGDPCGFTCTGATQETRSCGTAEDTTVTTVDTVTVGGGVGVGRQCVDTNPYDCGRWAEAGFCSDQNYVYYMSDNCCASCQGRMYTGPIRRIQTNYKSHDVVQMMTAELKKRKKKKK